MATGDTASDPLLAAVTKRGEEGSLTFTKDSKILARSAGTRQRHHQRAQPGTRPGCLRNQAVNTGDEWVQRCGGPVADDLHPAAPVPARLPDLDGHANQGFLAPGPA